MDIQYIFILSKDIKTQVPGTQTLSSHQSNYECKIIRSAYKLQECRYEVDLSVSNIGNASPA